MLVLSRKVNERIQIGDEITITVVRMSQGSVRIGIEAPPHLAILREELAAGQYVAGQCSAGQYSAGQCVPGAGAADEAGALATRAS